MSTTMLNDLINPQVMADAISAELATKLRAKGFMKVNTTLQGRAGNTITIPQFSYIGEATDLAEGVEGTVAKLTADDKQFTVKKAAKFVELTDESVLSGYGDPMSECEKQLRMSLEDKIDSDGIDVLETIDTATGGLTYDGGQLSTADMYDVVLESQDLLTLEEQETDFYLLVSRDVAKAIRKSEKFVDRATAMGDNVLATGVVGSVAGAKIIISNKLAELTAILLKNGALTTFMKRNAEVETQRDSKKKTTLVSADVHYVVACEDYSKLVKIEFTE